jgi:hypothetical protein
MSKSACDLSELKKEAVTTEFHYASYMDICNVKSKLPTQLKLLSNSTSQQTYNPPPPTHHHLSIFHYHLYMVFKSLSSAFNIPLSVTGEGLQI